MHLQNMTRKMEKYTMSDNEFKSGWACFKIQMILKLNELLGIHELKNRMHGIYRMQGLKS